MKMRNVCARSLGWVLGIACCVAGCARESQSPAAVTVLPQGSALDYVEVPAADTNVSAATNPASSGFAVSAPADVRTNGPAADVIRLARSGVDQEVILAYVTNSTAAFHLTAGEVIYLTNLGVPQGVVTAMLQHDQVLKTSAGVPSAPAATNPVAKAATAVPEPSNTAFYEALEPYGSWDEVDDYGLVWRPSVSIEDSSWQPYFDGGHWLYSDCGWYWVSEYSWGWAPFHYGRWFRHPHRGWCWAPDHVWGPSWVCWRYTSGHCGWAPLPPGARYQSEGGLTYRGQRVGVNFGFGLGVESFTFVPWGYFHDLDLREHAMPPGRVEHVFQQSVVATRFAGSNHNLSNCGISREHVATASRSIVLPVSLRDADGASAPGGRSERLSSDGRTLVVSRKAPAETFKSSSLGRERTRAEESGPSGSGFRPNDGAGAARQGDARPIPSSAQGESYRAMPPPSPAPRTAFAPPERRPEPVAAPVPQRPSASPQTAPTSPAPSGTGSPRPDQKGR